MKFFNRTIIWKITTLILVIFAFVNYGTPIQINLQTSKQSSTLQIVKPVLANELYQKFTCPCCGQPLNKEEPCCDSMSEMIEYIDQQVSLGLSEKEIIMATVKQFGIERLTEKSDQIAIKQQLTASAPANAPKLKIAELEQDLGKIGQAKGKTFTDFNFENQGQSNLIINKLNSSCGCTSATVIYKGTEGPEFSMDMPNKKNPTDWQVSISPGDTATLRVYYDPAVHPDLIGPVTRTVSIFSNDPVSFEQKVTITLEQTK